MSNSTTRPILTLEAGEKLSLPLEYTDDTDPRNLVPIDLTGSTIHFMAKADLDDLDADAVYSATVTSHTDAAAGLSAIPLDLSDEPASSFEDGRTLFAEITVEDSAGYRMKLEFDLVIGGAVQRVFA